MSSRCSPWYCGSRPAVAVARHFPTVVKIVEDSELEREPVLVRRDIHAIKGQRRIAIAYFQIAENWVICAVFLDHVNYTLDRRKALRKANRALDRSRKDCPSRRGWSVRQAWQAYPESKPGNGSDKPATQCKQACGTCAPSRVHRPVTRASALPFGGSDQESHRRRSPKRSDTSPWV